MPMQFDKFDVKTKEGIHAVTLGADMAFYIDEPPQEISQGILYAYEKFLELCPRENLRWYRTGSMEAHEPVSSRTFGMLATWLKPTAKPRRGFSFEVRDGEKMENVPAYRFYVSGESRESPYYSSRSNLLQILVPARFLSDNQEAFFSLVLDLSNRLPFISGHAGYVFERSRYAAYVDDAVYPLAMRHPGADISDVMEASRPTKSGAVKGVNWLTLLSASLVDKLGGLHKLRSYGGSVISVIETKHGVMLRAGDKPALGDVNRRDVPPAYRAAFALIKPVLVTWYPRFDLSRGDQQEQTNRWLHRFNHE